MNKSITINVSSVCGDPPYHFAKNEAVRLLELIRKGGNGDVKDEAFVFDFADIVGISYSGAQVLVTGLARRYGQWPERQLLFVNVAENLESALEDAVTNLTDLKGMLQS